MEFRATLRVVEPNVGGVGGHLAGAWAAARGAGCGRRRFTL